MHYDRKIKYFDYRMDGERMHGAGFVKMELRDEKCRLQFQISGLYATDDFTKEIYVIGKGRETELCKVGIKGGKGNVHLELQPDNLCGGVGYQEVDAFRVPIGAGRELYCSVSNAVIVVDNRGKREDVNKYIGVAAETCEAGDIDETRDVCETGRVSISEGGGESRGEVISEGIDERVSEGIDERVSEGAREGIGERVSEGTSEGIGERVSEGARERIDERVSEGTRERIDEGVSVEIAPSRSTKSDTNRVRAEQVSCAEINMEEDIQTLKMSESKWKQLNTIYPHMQPFGDERDYLKVGPQDFVVLSGKSYQLVHNSFLLHGYYNYQHLILSRQEGRGEIRYYIGVPGNFYEREKQVAVMFGFESFECKNEPAGMGDFGYYMIRVDL